MDDCVAIGSGKELTSISKSADARYGITGPGDVKLVPDMLLKRDRSARTIAISKEACIDSILTPFILLDATTVTIPLSPGSRLSVVDCPTSQGEIEEMATRPYRELVGALVWLTLKPRPDIAFATSSGGSSCAPHLSRIWAPTIPFSIFHSRSRRFASTGERVAPARGLYPLCILGLVLLLYHITTYLQTFASRLA